MVTQQIDQSDYIESAAAMTSQGIDYAANCKAPAPCKSCGGGCYGCKGSKAAESSSERRDTDLAEVVEDILD